MARQVLRRGRPRTPCGNWSALQGRVDAPVGDVVAPGCDMAEKANGPLLGNGHVGIQVSGTAERQRFHIAKNDFWTHNSAKVLDCPRALTMGGVTLDCPELKDASYRQEQQLYPACVAGAFGKGDHSLATRTWLCRGTNLLAIELRNEGKADLNVQASQWAGDPRPAMPARRFCHARAPANTPVKHRTVLRSSCATCGCSRHA